MLAPEQNMRSLPLVSTRQRTAGCSQGGGKLDVDAQIVGIELELVARLQASVLVDVERERRDRAFDLQPPVGVAVGMRIESHHSSSRLPPSGESFRAGPAALRNALVRFGCGGSWRSRRIARGRPSWYRRMSYSARRRTLRASLGDQASYPRRHHDRHP